MRNKKGLFIKGHSVPKKWKEKFSDSIKKRYKKGSKIGFQKGNQLGRGRHDNKGKHRSVKTEFKKGQNTGYKNCNWKGGISTKNDKIRHSFEMRLWQKSVLERDNFTCQKYKTRGGKLIAHHINNFSEFTELRSAIDNGITFSEKAHKEFHKKYGRRNNNKKQLKEFLEDNK